MNRSGARPEAPRRGPGLAAAGVAVVGATLARNPASVGGATAFLVVLFYVSANAIWYQPYPHPQPLMQTRLLIERPATPTVTQESAPSAAVEEETSPQTTRSIPQPDETVRGVQAALSALELYSGAVDGLTGPRTRKAVQAYQQSVGLEPTGVIDRQLLDRLAKPTTPRQPQKAATAKPVEAVKPAAELAPKPAVALPQARPAVVETVSAPPGQAGVGQAEIVRIQAGLRAFGHEGIEIDGVLGDRTRAAIREFQNLFGLPVNGTPDAALLAKMTEIGLTN